MRSNSSEMLAAQKGFEKPREYSAREAMAAESNGKGDSPLFQAAQQAEERVVLLADGRFGAGQLEEPVRVGAFDDGAEECVPRLGRRRLRGHRHAAVVGARHLDEEDRALPGRHLRGLHRGPALELTRPPLRVRHRVPALAGAEVEDGALAVAAGTWDPV